MCSRTNQVYLCLGLIALLASVTAYCLAKPARGPGHHTEYDVFISYRWAACIPTCHKLSSVTCCSHHDAEFAEKVLYPGLEQQGVKCCIHTVHWQVDIHTLDTVL